MSTRKQPKQTKRGEGQTTLTISLPEELKKKIESAAEGEQRSVSNYLVVELSKIAKHNHSSIVAMHRSGMSYTAIAAATGIKSKGTISYIIRRSMEAVGIAD